MKIVDAQVHIWSGGKPGRLTSISSEVEGETTVLRYSLCKGAAKGSERAD